MMLFVAHDYLVGQQDIDAQEHTVSTICHASADAKTHTLCVEHQVFHAPALESAASSPFYDSDADRHEYSHDDLFSQLHPFDLLTPPKTL